MLELNTFSIAARCPHTGMLGVAASTAMPAVGANCPFVLAGVGAIATQAWVNPYLGLDGLRLLERGLSADEALKTLLTDDPRPRLRQIGIVDSRHQSAAHSGDGCTEWAGHATGPGYAIQGNMLTGPETVAAMTEAFLATDAELPERLLRSIEAGQRNGGDKRGKQSAALKVAKTEEYPFIDHRVDEHPNPVHELRRIYEVAKRQLIPFVETFPTRSNPSGSDDPVVIALVAKPPGQRGPV